MPDEEWVRMRCAEDLRFLIARHPVAFCLLAYVAAHARQKPGRSKTTGLDHGEAMIRDWKETGAKTRNQFRHAQQVLANHQMCSFRGTRYGTVGRIENQRVFASFEAANNQKATTSATRKQPEDHQNKPPREWSPDPIQLRINSWFSRRDSTRWDERELRSYRKIAFTDEDLELLDAYYTAKLPRDDDPRRRNLVTLLNNWNGEIDRARKWQDGRMSFRNGSKPPPVYKPKPQEPCTLPLDYVEIEKRRRERAGK